MTDFLTREGAETLARRIRLYWRNRASVWVEAAGRKIDGQSVFVVRSDLVNGVPRR